MTSSQTFRDCIVLVVCCCLRLIALLEEEALECSEAPIISRALHKVSAFREFSGLQRSTHPGEPSESISAPSDHDGNCRGRMV